MNKSNETRDAEIGELIGKTLVECTGEVNGREIIFRTTTGETFKLYHEQDCCEEVIVEDICGELSDLVGSPITQAEANSNSDPLPGGNSKESDSKESEESFTWTFYRLATAKGQVVIRWYGSSNGYYSEEVDFVLLGPEDIPVPKAEPAAPLDVEAPLDNMTRKLVANKRTLECKHVL